MWKGKAAKSYSKYTKAKNDNIEHNGDLSDHAYVSPRLLIQTQKHYSKQPADHLTI